MEHIGQQAHDRHPREQGPSKKGKAGDPLRWDRGSSRLSPSVSLRPRHRRTQISNRQLWLNQAGVAVTPTQFVAGSVAVGAVAFVAIVAVTGAPLVALVPAAGVAALPRAYFARKRTAHLQRVQAAWPDGLRDLIASIAAGRSLPQALNALAASGPAPLQEAFARFPMLARMLGTVPALEVVKEELTDPTTVSTHTWVGGHRAPAVMCSVRRARPGYRSAVLCGLPAFDRCP
jgi:Flp pilus assembly protein TadB